MAYLFTKKQKICSNDKAYGFYWQVSGLYLGYNADYLAGRFL